MLTHTLSTCDLGLDLSLHLLTHPHTHTHPHQAPEIGVPVAPAHTRVTKKMLRFPRERANAIHREGRQKPVSAKGSLRGRGGGQEGV